ncbi:MAG: XisI protein [Gemmataceae bacterium]
MDRVTRYKAALDEIVRRVGRYMANAVGGPPMETSVITDAEHGQYGLIETGWSPDGRRLVNTLLLARVKDGKVWVEEDNTDLTLADELLRAGVPREDIVLAFHPPDLRHLTEFAVS